MKYEPHMSFHCLLSAYKYITMRMYVTKHYIKNLKQPEIKKIDQLQINNSETENKFPNFNIKVRKKDIFLTCGET